MSSVMDEHDGGYSRTNLNSHTNMVVVGKQEKISDDTGNKVDVIPITPDFQIWEKVSTVYVAFQYTCQYTAKVYVLVFSNALSVTSMYNNLILPFIMVEGGLVVKDTKTIHAIDTSVEDHSIYFTN